MFWKERVRVRMAALGLCAPTYYYYYSSCRLPKGGNNVPSGRGDWRGAVIRCGNNNKKEGSGPEGRVRSNARRVKEGVPSRPSLGIDYGEARTGIAVGRGYFPRPLQVVKHRGQKLETYLIQSAEKEGADEFVIGLPKSSDGLETDQSCKVRSFAGRLAALAALRGWRVYLQDEHGTSEDALDYMIKMGSSKRSRKEQLDAYAAVVVLQRYFERDEAELMFPKDSKLHHLLLQGPANMQHDDDDDDDGGECFEDGMLQIL